MLRGETPPVAVQMIGQLHHANCTTAVPLESVSVQLLERRRSGRPRRRDLGSTPATSTVETSRIN